MHFSLLIFCPTKVGNYLSLKPDKPDSICVHVCGHTCHRTCVGIRGQHIGVGILLSVVPEIELIIRLPEKCFYALRYLTNPGKTNCQSNDLSHSRFHMLLVTCQVSYYDSSLTSVCLTVMSGIKHLSSSLRPFLFLYNRLTTKFWSRE